MTHHIQNNLDTPDYIRILWYIKNKVMRNKQLLQSRLGKLNGLIQRQDMNVNRGGTQREYNDTQIEIKETIQDIMDIVEREA